MDDLFFGKVQIPRKHLFHVSSCLLFRQTFLQTLAEIRFAELGDDVSIVLGGVDLVEVEDVRQISEFFQDLYLALE